MHLGRSVEALMQRGLDSTLAQSLVERGYTITKLKKEPLKRLLELGVPEAAARTIHSGSRPPIPATTLHKLLFDNAWTCCVCRQHDKAIIVHHIIDWAKSRSHEPTNLAVLCLDDHNNAHSKLAHTQNLTPAVLKASKNAWEDEVRSLTTIAVLNSAHLPYSTWLYFNHLRLFEMARALKVPLLRLPHAASARAAKLIDGEGQIRPRDASLTYMYEGGEGNALYTYVRDVLEAVLHATPVINISDELERSGVRSMIVPGDLIFVQGAHRFKSETKRNGKGQRTRGTRRANHVRIEYVFDKWEATSMSALSEWLEKTKAVGSLVHLKHLERDGADVVLKGTIIAITNGASDMKTRRYEGANIPVHHDDDEDLDEEDFAFD